MKKKGSSATDGNLVSILRVLGSIERRLEMVENVLVYKSQPSKTRAATPKANVVAYTSDRVDEARSETLLDIQDALHGIAYREDAVITVEVKFSPKK